MRSLIISSALFVLCAVFMLINSLHLTSYTQDMLDKIDNLPTDISISDEAKDDAVRALNAMCAEWYDRRDGIAATVSYEYITALTSALNSAMHFAATDEDGEYLAALSELRESVTRLHELERLSWRNVI